MELLFACALSAVAIATLALLRAYVWTTLRLLWTLNKQGIKGPNFRPLLGHMPEIRECARKARANPSWTSSPMPFVAMLAAKYGSTCYYCVGPIVRLVITDPKIIRQAYVNNNDCYVKSSFTRSFKLFGNGLFTASGHLWARQRRLINPAFHHKEIKRMYGAMVKSTKEAFCLLNQQITGGQIEFDMYNELNLLTLNIIGKAAFGADIGGTGQEAQETLLQFKSYIETVISYMCGQGLIPLYRHFPSAKKKNIKVQESRIRKLMLALINRRRLEREKRRELDSELNEDNNGTAAPTDLLELMLSATQENETGSDKKEPPTGSLSLMSDQQLLDECVTFLVAGHETTANLLTWTMLLLANHPEWQEKAREEVLNVCGSTEPPSFEQLSQLKTLTWILYESLRLFPPAAVVARTCVQSNSLDGLYVPKGVDIVLPIAIIHRKPELWGDDANMFKPERFSNGIGKAATHPMAFLPFSVGPRTCIGQTFALSEAKLILASLCQSVKWKIAPGYRHCPEISLTMRPRYGLPVLLESTTP